MDRGHPKLVPKVDALNPGLLRLIALTVEGARKHGRFTGVRGHRGDAQAVPILVGLGVDELSVSLPSIPTMKAQVRRLSYADCQELAHPSLKCRTGDEAALSFPKSNLNSPDTMFSNAFSFLQKIGKCMMVPVSVLPVAGILLGVGSANFTWLPQMSLGSWPNRAARSSQTFH